MSNCKILQYSLARTHVISHNIHMEGRNALSKNHKGMHMLADSTFGPDQPGGNFVILSVQMISLAALGIPGMGSCAANNI